MFKISDYLTQDEWITSFVMYLAHAMVFPESFPLSGTLSTYLCGGIWLLNALGYRGWKGIKMGETRFEIEYLDALEEKESAAAVLQEWLDKNLHLHARWGEAISWLEAQIFVDSPPEHKKAVLDLLRDRMGHMDPLARVGWAGFAPEDGLTWDGDLGISDLLRAELDDLRQINHLR